MNLMSVYFTYNTPNKKFNSMSYDFKPVLDKSDSKRIIELTKNSIQELEDIVAKTYKKFDKKETGEITPYEISQGYEYHEKKGIFSKFNFVNSIKLEYKLRLNSDGIPTEMNIAFRNHDQKQILFVHDIIISNPDLMVTDNAKRHLENIEYLRNKKFEVSKYLHLKE